jgi:hypothetical protein
LFPQDGEEAGLMLAAWPGHLAAALYGDLLLRLARRGRSSRHVCAIA